MTDQQTLYGHVVTESAILYHHRIQVCDGVIVAIEADEPKTGKDTLLPGFGDQHIHDLIGQPLAASSPKEELCRRFGVVLGHGLDGLCRQRQAGRQAALGIHVGGHWFHHTPLPLDEAWYRPSFAPLIKPG
jgi:hypothetical protein